MKAIKNPTFMLVLSMVIFGTIGPLVRATGLASGEIALYRAVMAAILIGAFIIVTGQHIPFSLIKKQIPLLILSGVAMGFNWILLFEAYKYTTVSVATLSYYFAPVLVTLVCPILFREKMTVKSLICFLFSTVGLVLITGLGELYGSNHMIGILFGLSAAVLYATVIILNKFIKNVEGIHRTFLQFLAAIVVLLPYVALTDGFNLVGMETGSLSALLTVGILHTGIAYCAYFSSLKELAGQKVAILSYIDPLVAVLISVTFLGEEMTALQWIGGFLILGFTLLNEIKLRRER